MAASESDPKGGAGSGEGAEPTSEGACGWSKPQVSLELTCSTEMGGVSRY